MIADALRANGHYVELARAADFVRRHGQLRGGKPPEEGEGEESPIIKRPLPTIDVCVCVKFCSQAIADACRARGNAALVWDTLDVPLDKLVAASSSGSSVVQPLAVTSVDVVLANSKQHAQLLQERHGAAVVRVVYHHHSNSPQLGLRANSSLVIPLGQRLKAAAATMNPPRRRRLCFTGNKENLLVSSVHETFTAIAAKHDNMSFVVIPVPSAAELQRKNASSSSEQGDVDDPYNQRHVLAALAHSTCDVALLWPPNHADVDEFTLKYRPITRLSTCW